MSNKITEVVNELVEVIENSEQFQTYMKQKEVVAGDSDLHSKIDEIRRLNFQLQTEKDSNAAYDEQDNLERRFEELSVDKRVYDYIQAETDIVRIYQEVNQKILDLIQFV